MNTRNLLLIALVIAVGGMGYWMTQAQQRANMDAASLADATTYTSGPFRVTIALNPSAPMVGENQLSIQLADQQGQAVTAARIQAYGEMPAMGAMSAMRAPADLQEVEPGLYSGPLELEMRGEWPLSVTIAKDGLGEARLGFDMATGREGLSISSGGRMVAASQSMQPTTNTMADEHAGDAMGMKMPGQSMAHDHAADDTVYSCPMHPSVRKPGPGQCPICGMNLEPMDNNMQTHADHADMHTGNTQPAMSPVQEGGVAYYTCPMHPSVRESQPGQCPICGMDLSAVSHEDINSGVITVDARRRQMIGVQTAKAQSRELNKSIRAVGKVTYDERRIINVTLKFDAWIGELQADFVGVQVEKGQALLSVYSPELLSAQQEYLETRQRLSGRGPNDSLLAAARRRLMLWGITDEQIKALERRGEALEYLPIFAPASGTVVEKMVNEGSAVKTGAMLLRIADLSTVWIDAEVYEADLPLMRTGMAATVTLPLQSGAQFDATVDYIYPYLSGATRTARIRLVLDNPAGVLKPDMFAEVALKADLGRRLAVPSEAVLIAGETRVVFKDLGDDGKLKPIRVKTGQRVGDWVEITDGLSPGDTVVTSGNFLIAAEAKLKTGIEQW
ncbi:MAG: efflux RND transporter periplasmic adaptor subunit [Oceanococcus sp.]|nr:MAG: efflux RND transporter periplasmic adaptor subunit [Oceanococcus sp.]